MENLPLETLQDIFKLACTDGGATGCALSLTSRYVHAASRTSRFHSISLHASPRRLNSFVSLYRRAAAAALEEGYRAALEHLYIAFAPEDVGHGSFLEDARTLSRIVAQDLLSLVIQLTTSSRTGMEAPTEQRPLLAHTFPALRDFSSRADRFHSDRP